MDDHRVDWDLVGGLEISTVELFGGTILGVRFETMVFVAGHRSDLYCERYRTFGGARRGHIRVVRALRSGSMRLFELPWADAPGVAARGSATQPAWAGSYDRASAALEGSQPVRAPSEVAEMRAETYDAVSAPVFGEIKDGGIQVESDDQLIRHGQGYSCGRP